jgi:uncharacterized phage-like protein YoqJ
MIVAVTGHRPQSLDGDRDYKSPLWQEMGKWFSTNITRLKPDLVVTGGAIGVDQFLAKWCYDLGVPYEVARPWADYHVNFNAKDHERLAWLIARAALDTVVYTGGYSVGKLHGRNHYMVDKADKVMAVWNGEPEGGTFACLTYARDRGKSVLQHTPADWTYNMVMEG